jgi:hypothetical protein
MAKPKFDPSIVESKTPSSGLKPFDYMRPMADDHSELVQTAPEPSKAPAAGAVRPPSASQREDARYLPVPPDDVYEAKTYRLSRHRHRQLRDEAFYTDQDIQVIVDTALGEYFEKRYGTPPSSK